MTTKKALAAKIDAFLADKKLSDGGLASVELSEVAALQDIIDELVQAKYQADPDGELPIDVRLTDRTRFERPVVLPVPYPYEGRSQTYTYERLQQRASTHAQLAAAYADAARRDMESLRLFVNDAVQKERPLKLGDLTYRPEPKLNKGVQLDTEWLTQKAAKAYRAENQKNPCPVDFTARTRWADKVAQKLTKDWGPRVEVQLCRVVFEGLKINLYLPASNLSLEFLA